MCVAIARPARAICQRRSRAAHARHRCTVIPCSSLWTRSHPGNLGPLKTSYAAPTPRGRVGPSRASVRPRAAVCMLRATWPFPQPHCALSIYLSCRIASPRSPVARRRPLPRRAEPPPPLLCRSTAELAVHPFPSSSPTSASPPALRKHRRTVARPPDSAVTTQARLQQAVSDRHGASARRGHLRSGFHP
jgi:hypothetical protein